MVIKKMLSNLFIGERLKKVQQDQEKIVKDLDIIRLSLNGEDNYFMKYAADRRKTKKRLICTCVEEDTHERVL